MKDLLGKGPDINIQDLSRIIPTYLTSPTIHSHVQVILGLNRDTLGHPHGHHKLIIFLSYLSGFTIN